MRSAKSTLHRIAQAHFYLVARLIAFLLPEHLWYRTLFRICRVEQHYCIIVKADIRTIFAAQFTFCTNDYCLTNSSFLNSTCRQSVFYRYNNLITHMCIVLSGISQYPDT